MTSRSSPRVPGWTVVDDDGTYVATRRQELTWYQRQWGALSEVDARTSEELWLLCDAQNRLAERLALAESTRPKVDPHPKVLAKRQAEDETRESR